MMTVKDRVAVVTGAARGIGLAVARALAANGAAVLAVDARDCDAFVVEGKSAGWKVAQAKADVSNYEAMESAVAEAVRRFGKLDAFVACAAFSERAPFYDQPLEDFRRTIDVTMWGPFFGLRASVRQMRQQGGGGSAVIVSSPHAVVAVPNTMAYNMAKAAIDMMARTAAAELFSDRIRVNIVHPGWTDTPGERKFFTDEELEEQGAKLPAGRLARPDEIARGVLFLVCDEAEYVNGSTVTIDGGIQLPWAQII